MIDWPALLITCALIVAFPAGILVGVYLERKKPQRDSDAELVFPPGTFRKSGH